MRGLYANLHRFRDRNCGRRKYLDRAAGYGHKGIVELLIAAGAEVNTKDKFGKTPLDYAIGEIADLLYKYGGKT